MTLAQNILKHRRRLNLSQEELAEKCDVSRQAIAKWEIGDSVPTLDKLIYLSDIFVISLDELVGKQDDYALFENYIKRYLHSEKLLDFDNDLSEVLNRFLTFSAKHGICEEDIIKGVYEVFLFREQGVEMKDDHCKNQL